MNTVIEVAAAEATVLMASPKVRTIKSFFPKVAALTSVVATSVLRSLSQQGRTSQNAVSPDYNFNEGGLAVA